MRKVQVVIATVGGLLIALSVAELAAQPANNEKASATGPNAGNSGAINAGNANAAPVRRAQPEPPPFACFGDAACEREILRQKRALDPTPLRQGQRRDPNEGPLLEGIPGQTEVPGFSDTPIPTVPAN